MTALYFTIAKSSAPTAFLFKSRHVVVRADRQRIDWGPIENDNVMLKNISPFANSDLHIIACHVSLSSFAFVPWFQLQLHFIRLAFSSIVAIGHELDYGTFTLKTKTKTKTTFSLEHVWLDYNLRALETFLQQESQFRLVASIQVREWNAAKQMSQHVHYMGRAQKIATTSDGTRIYKWTSKREESAFPGVHLLNETNWEQQTQDHFIRIKLNLKVPSEQDRVYTSALTTRARRSSIASTEADNDGFSNPVCLLPIPVKAGQYFTLKIHNLLVDEKECPSVEISLRTAANGLSAETNMAPNMRVHVKYDDEMQLAEISLVVKNYQTTLSNLKIVERFPLTI